MFIRRSLAAACAKTILSRGGIIYMDKTRSNSSGRVLEIELMKAIAIIGMVMVHVLGSSILLDIKDPKTYPVAFLIVFFGSFPSAGVFMAAMGWGAAFSKNATVSTFLNRVVSLFIAGIFVNLFTQYLRAVLVPDVYGPIQNVWPYVLATDIYFFAALANLYFALMKKLESSKSLRITVSILLVGVCFLINILVPAESFTTGNEWLDTILGLFIRLNDRSYFPFISWIFFPVVGYGAACYFQKHGMSRTLIAGAVTGAAAVAVGLALRSALGMPLSVFAGAAGGEYYRLHPAYALSGYAIIVIEFIIVRLILQASGNRMPGFMLTMSKTVAHIYIVQWSIISILSPVLVSITNIWINAAFGIAILIVSYYIGILLKKKNIIRI